MCYATYLLPQSYCLHRDSKLITNRKECSMKKISTLFVILFAAMAVCGCGNSLQEAQVKKPDSIQQKEQKNKTSELFEAIRK